MNKLIVLVLLIGTFNVNAQGYFTFPKNNAQWGYHYHNTTDDMDSWWDYYYLEGDTIVNEIKYQVIKGKRWYAPNDDPTNLEDT